MDALRKIAEERIRAAMAAGEFENLPGRGRPLELEDDSSVPADLRMAFRILKRASVLPEELELRKSLVSLDALIAACTDTEEAKRLVTTRNRLELRYRLLSERRLRGPAARKYSSALRRKLGV